MAHQVETMAYAGETPWHGLGVRVEPTLTAEEMMTAAGLDWTVSKRRLSFKTGKDSRKAIPGRYAVVRDSDDQLMGLSADRFQPLQNRDIFDFYHRFVAEAGMEMHTAGSLLDGRLVWALARVGDSFTLEGGDKTEGFILMMNSHEPGRAAVIQHTSVRVVCWNTLSAALGAGLKGRGAYRFQHTAVFDDGAKAAAQEAMGLSREHLQRMRAAAERLAAIPVTPELADSYFRRVFKLDPADLAVRALSDGAEAAAASRIRESRVMPKLRLALESGPGAGLPSARGTAWGALNAVTFVVDHQLGLNREKVLRDSWLGYRGETKRRALNLALQLAS